MKRLDLYLLFPVFVFHVRNYWKILYGNMVLGSLHPKLYLFDIGSY
jgi:hypothetical protein